MTPQDKYQKIYEVINFPYDEGDAVYSEVTIGDVLDWMDNNYDIPNDELRIFLNLWKNKRLPLSPTDEKLIDYIYNLLP